MNYCRSCGSSIPDNQRNCSMCMGDINHGTDGYYEQWARERLREEEEQEEMERLWGEEHEKSIGR
ncbi:MAG: hypothetical protein LBF78_13605 [Treponema sp.]|nr:hypothetical protein [Treponema sp.]